MVYVPTENSLWWNKVYQKGVQISVIHVTCIILIFWVIVIYVENKVKISIARVHGIINESLHQDNKSTHVCKVHDIICFENQSVNAEKSWHP